LRIIDEAAIIVENERSGVDLAAAKALRSVVAAARASTTLPLAKKAKLADKK
jgi:hypothetical protein